VLRIVNLLSFSCIKLQCFGFTFGFAVYTANEYIIHYFLFHVVAKNYPEKWWPSRLYYKAHGRHHKFPNEIDRVVLPVVHQWVLVFLLTAFWRVVFIAYPVQVTYLFGSGIMFGYSFYEIAHIYAHGHPVVKYLKFLDVAADYHMAHHKVSSKANFGFCSPVCDYFNGTILDRGDLNPFKWSEMKMSVVGFLAGLPLPIPFYHWVMMYLKRHSAVYRKVLKVERFAIPSTDSSPVTDPHLG
jgi:hypothetical protein